MACGSDDTYEIAGEMGVGVLAFGAYSPDKVGERVRAYREKLKDAKPVGQFVHDKVAAFCMMYCGESDDEADETAGPTVMWYDDIFARFFNVSQQAQYKGADHRTFEPKAVVHEKRKKKPDMRERLARARANRGLCVGSAESIIKVIKRYEANGIDQVMFIVQSGMLQHPKIMESLKRFAKDVMPAFGR